MSENDCGPSGWTSDGLTTRVDGFTMQNIRRNTPNAGLTMRNACEKASRMQKRFLDGIQSVKEKLCGMWNAIAAYVGWRSDPTINVVLKSTGSKSNASNSTRAGSLEILIEKPNKSDKPPLNAKFIGDAYGTEDIIASRDLVANQTLSALTDLASYGWICIFLGWMVPEILAAVCGIEVPDIGWLWGEDQVLYKAYIDQSSVKLQTLVSTIIPPFYLLSWVLVAILFTNVILYSTGFKSVIPPHSSTTTVSSIPSVIPTSIVPIAWSSRAIAWTTHVAATCTSKVRSTALSWWSSKLMAKIHLLVFSILFALSAWSYGVAGTMDPGFLPENEWPYTGDPFGDDHFIPHHMSSTPDVLSVSHSSGTSRVFDSAYTLDSTLGSLRPIATSHRTVNMNGNADRMINMKGRYLWYWPDEETRLWVAKQWEGSASSANNAKAAQHDKSTSKSIRRSKWQKNSKEPVISPENGVSNTLANDMATTNTMTARVSNPFHDSFDKESPDPNIEGEMSDVGFSLNFGADEGVRDTKWAMAGGEDGKMEFNHKKVDYVNPGKNGESVDHHLSLYDQAMLYRMAVNHYFDTVFSDSDRMLASGVLETSKFTNHYSYSNSTAYVAGSSSTGYINSAGHDSTGHMNDPAGYIHRHGGTQPVDYDPRRYVQSPIKHDTSRPIQYNPTRPIHYDPFRRIFVPYGAQYSGIHNRYVVGLQTYPPLMMKWISGFLGNSIGFRNEKAFSLFLLYSGMLSCYVLIVLGGEMLALIWNLKSLALIEATESRSVDGSLKRGLLQKSSRKEQRGPETDEGLTGKSTKNETKISISGRERNVMDNNYMTTIAEAALDTTSTTVSLKINYLFKSYYPNLVVFGWCLLHGMCSLSMMQDGLWNGQHGFWNALNNGIGSPYIGNVRSVVCSFLPHEACLERNTIQDYVLANKGAAFAETQDPNTEYPSSDSNHVYTTSERNSIIQSFLQEKESLKPDPPVGSDCSLRVDKIRDACHSDYAFDGIGPQGTCKIMTDAPCLKEAFQKLAEDETVRPRVLKFDGGWEFDFLDSGFFGKVYHFHKEPPVSGCLSWKTNHCTGFVTKIITRTGISEQVQEKLEIKLLRENFPERVFAPQYPRHDHESVFDSVTVTFSPYGAGGSVYQKIIKGDLEFVGIFFQEFGELLSLVSRFNNGWKTKGGETVGPVVHRDIKPHNLVFTSDRADENCRVAIIDWDLVISKKVHDSGSEIVVGTPAYMVETDNHGRRSNDQYALVLSAAAAMRPKGSLPLMKDNRWPSIVQWWKKKGSQPVKAITCIPEVVHDLVKIRIQSLQSTGRDDTATIYYGPLRLFIVSYLTLWDVNSMGENPHRCDSGLEKYQPPIHCFSDNHKLVTVKNLLSTRAPDSEPKEFWADEQPSVQHITVSKARDLCKQCWQLVQKSIRCVMYKQSHCAEITPADESNFYKNAFGIILENR